VLPVTRALPLQKQQIFTFKVEDLEVRCLTQKKVTQQVKFQKIFAQRPQIAIALIGLEFDWDIL